MKRVSILLLFLIIAGDSTCQNALNPDGLKIGKWKIPDSYQHWTVDEYIEGLEKILVANPYGPRYFGISEGNYKIVDTNIFDSLYFFSYDPVDQRGDANFRKLKSQIAKLEFEGIAQSNIAVKDSIWNFYDQKDRLITSAFYDSGVLNWYKIFDTLGNLVESIAHDYVNDSITISEYKFKRLFKKKVYVNRRSKTVYYPTSGLVISNAEPKLYADLLLQPADTVEVTIAPQTGLSILAISQVRQEVWITDTVYKPIKLPIKLAVGQQYKLKLIFKPSINTIDETEEIVIETDEPKDNRYFIYCSLWLGHIGGRTTASNPVIRLSKSKDTYLILNKLREISSVSIRDGNQHEETIPIKGITKLPLTEFKKGLYTITLSGQERKFETKLEVTE